MGPGIEPLTLRDRDLVVDPMMVRVPNPGVTVFGRNVHAGRTGGMLEVLQAPRVRFTDRHGAKISAGAGSANGTHQHDDEVSAILEHERMDGKISSRIRPRGDRLPSGPARQRRE